MSIMSTMDKKILKMVVVAIFILGAIYTLMAVWLTH